MISFHPIFLTWMYQRRCVFLWPFQDRRIQIAIITIKDAIYSKSPFWLEILMTNISVLYCIETDLFLLYIFEQESNYYTQEENDYCSRFFSASTVFSFLKISLNKLSFILLQSIHMAWSICHSFSIEIRIWYFTSILIIVTFKYRWTQSKIAFQDRISDGRK